MTDRELMQQALDALEKLNKDGWILADFEDEVYASIEALRARLAQPEPEPVAWHEPEAYGNVTVYEKWANENGWLPLYTAPPQRQHRTYTLRKWVGLTDEQVQQIEMSASSKLSAIYLAEAQLKGINAL